MLCYLNFQRLPGIFSFSYITAIFLQYSYTDDTIGAPRTRRSKADELASLYEVPVARTILQTFSCTSLTVATHIY